MNGLLKFITCGSVDDGKSTLIGHMLYDAKLLFADQEKALELDSKIGSRGGDIDYSLLLDGLIAEREQGITIDVAYRYFTTEHRSFIVADTPGHEEYTRNMAVGASFADLAIILIDASKGVLIQTKRHSRICSLMGIKHFVFAINKMDLIEYDRVRFDKIKYEINNLLNDFNYESVKVIPVSATEGDNITSLSNHMSWYKEETLLAYLEEIDITPHEMEQGFTMPVQRVCRPDHTFRGFQGQVESGRVAVGDEITALPSNEKANVKGIILGGKNVDSAENGNAVTIQLDREVDISRGCVLANNTRPFISSILSVKLLWMDENDLVVGKNYIIKLGTKKALAVVKNIEHKIDVNTGNKVATDKICKNEIALCTILVIEKIVFEKFSINQSLGCFILIDRLTHMTSACGIVEDCPKNLENLTWYDMDITREQRAKQKSQKPKTIWFTGLSGAGKTTLANELEKRLFVQGIHTMTLDGDNIRYGLNSNLSFCGSDRNENIRRIAEVAKLMNDAGLVVIASFVSPYESDRLNAKKIIGYNNFIEVYVSTSIEECEKRDVKGLYKKAKNGEISCFTGISDSYDVPEDPDIIIDTSKLTIHEASDQILRKLAGIML